MLPESIPCSDSSRGWKSAVRLVPHREQELFLDDKGGLMDVTEVKVFPVEEERLKAYVTITFDHCFVIRDLKLSGS